VAVSVAQLATNVTGLVVALRRRHPYDVFWMHGQADTVARDAILRGTALSAPVSNLLAQAAMTVLVARRPSHGAARALAGLGALQVPGTSANGCAAAPAPIRLGRGRVAPGRRRHRPGRCDGRARQPGGALGRSRPVAHPGRGRSWPGRSRRVAARRPALPRGRPGPAAGRVLRADRRARQPHRPGTTVPAAIPQAPGQALHHLRSEPQARAAGRRDHQGPGRPLRRGHRPPVPRPGIGPWDLHRGLDRPAVRHRPPAAGPPDGAGRDRLPAVAPRPGGAAPVRRADPAGSAPSPPTPPSAPRWRRRRSAAAPSRP
jgi:hypothetical protein